MTITGSATGTSISVSIGNSPRPSGLLRVYAQTTCGSSTYTGMTISACADGIGMSEDKTGSMFTLYPNPTSNEFTIDVTTDVDKDVVVEVYDVLGNIVKHEKHQLTSGVSSMKTNIEDYKNGIYFVRVMDMDNTTLYTQRVIKQ